MACANLVSVGSGPPVWGVPDEELSLSTQSVAVTLTSDIKELRNGCGEVSNVAFYNRQNEVEITGYGYVGTSNDDVGDTVVLANAAVFSGELLVGTLYVTKITATLSNEDYIQTVVSLKGWDAIGA